jgi:hypothetical protein
MRRRPEPNDSILVVTDEEGQPTTTDAETDDARTPPVGDRGAVNQPRPRPGPYARQPRRMSRGRATSSVLEAMQLVRQVENLRRRRDELMALYVARLLDTGRQDHLVTTVLLYYDTFSSGYSTPRVRGIFQYLNNHIDREVFQYGATGLGTDMWIEQWRRYTKLFPSISIRVRATICSYLIDPGDVHAVTDAMTTVCVVEAQGRMAGVVSRDAIAAILPHVLNREDLLSKLLGKPLDCPVGLRFYFNSAGRVTRIDLDVDFFRGFHSIETVTIMDLAQIMDGANIGENSMLSALE